MKPRTVWSDLYAVVTNETFMLLVSAAALGLLVGLLMGGWGGVFG